jgi:cob(I)alamin adenosyltransferase
MGLKKGFIQIYTGEGKGKTTAALGLALRAVGRELKVVVIQFLKGDRETGELNMARSLSPQLVIKPMGRDGFVDPDNPGVEDIRLAREALEEAERILDERVCDVLILDEINVAVSLNLIEEGAVLKLMDDKPDNVELILTGRGAPASLLEKADLVTKMESTKHYFDHGIGARKGIEY